MKQPEVEPTDNQYPATDSGCLAARSARAAWELLRQDEQCRLLAYAEKALGWEAAPPPPDTTCCNTNERRKGVPSGKVKKAS